MKINLLIKKLLEPLGRALARLISPFLPTNKPISLAANFVFPEAVPGDYLEFGTFKGASFIEAYRLCEKAFERWDDPATNRAAFSIPNNAPITKKKQSDILHLTRLKGFQS